MIRGAFLGGNLEATRDSVVVEEELLSQPDADDGWSRRATAWLGAVGAVGMTLLALTGVVVGPHGTGSPIERAVLAWTPNGTAAAVTSGFAFGLGFLLVFTAWLVLGLRLRRGASLRPLYRISALWAAPLVLGPPIFSRDAYSYAALGEMVRSHLNPYRVGPAALGFSRFAVPVGPAWLHTRSPYGPLFIGLSSMIVRISNGSVLRTVLVLRLVEMLALVMIAVVLPRLARATGKDPARAVWLGVVNPLVLLHFIGGAHNDALMVALILAGLAAGIANRPVLGVVLCVFAAAIKAPAIIAAAFIAADAVRALPPGKRLVGLVRLTGIGAAVFVAITAVTGVGWGWIAAMGVPGSNHLLLTPTTFVAQIVSDVVGHDAAVLAVVRVAGYAVAMAGIAYLLWRAPRIGTTRACGLALALVVALGPIVLPWYALWGVILIAPAGRRIERGYAIIVSVALALVVQPSGSSMPDFVLVAAMLLLSSVALAIVLRPARRWIRGRLATAIDDYRSGGEAARLSDIVRSAV